MTLENIKNMLKSSAYSFLRDNKNLGSNIILLGLGGSHAYGTNTPDSDLDIRGIATNTSFNVLCSKDFEQVVDVETDTTIYSVEKMFKLLCACNPNTIEILGLNPEHYLYLSDAGNLILDNRKLFLSQLAIHSFSGYANSQLRRLENKSSRVGSQEAFEINILKSIECAMFDFKSRHPDMGENAVNLYISDSLENQGEKEIFVDLKLTHYPLRDYANFHGEMLNIVKQYSKHSHRNANAINHNKLGKHMMHLIRLYLMCIDILEKEEIITYRKDDLPLLMDIRNGKYLDEDQQPLPEFYELLDSFEKRLDYAKANTSLPTHVDMNKVNELLFEVNRKVVMEVK